MGQVPRSTVYLVELEIQILKLHILITFQLQKGELGYFFCYGRSRT